jgi:hypothetical protein
VLRSSAATWSVTLAVATRRVNLLIRATTGDVIFAHANASLGRVVGVQGRELLFVAADGGLLRFVALAAAARRRNDIFHEESAGVRFALALAGCRVEPLVCAVARRYHFVLAHALAPGSVQNRLELLFVAADGGLLRFVADAVAFRRRISRFHEESADRGVALALAGQWVWLSVRANARRFRRVGAHALAIVGILF